MEEEVGFEPTEGFPSPPFQDGAIGHSAILPFGVKDENRTRNYRNHNPGFYLLNYRHHKRARSPQFISFCNSDANYSIRFCNLEENQLTYDNVGNGRNSTNPILVANIPPNYKATNNHKSHSFQTKVCDHCAGA